MKSVGLTDSSMAPRAPESFESPARGTESKPSSLSETQKKDLHLEDSGNQDGKLVKHCAASALALGFIIGSPCHPSLTSLGVGAASVASSVATAWCWLSGAELPEKAKPLTEQETSELLKANPELKKQIEAVSKNYAGIGIKSISLINPGTVNVDWDDDAMCWFEGPPSIFTFKSE